MFGSVALITLERLVALLAGLCVRHPDLHLPQRCDPSGPLTWRAGCPPAALALNAQQSRLLLRPGCCSAATGWRPIRNRSNKLNPINALMGDDVILTWLDAVSMVRAAFEGDGASFPLTAALFGSPHHGGRHGRRRQWKSRSIVVRRSCAFRKARKSGSAVVRNAGQPENRD